MAKEIQHIGTVASTKNGKVFVRIMQTTACASCSVKGMCSSSESKEKIIEVHCPLNHYQIGDKVMVVGSLSMGFQAVLWAFIYPFLLVVLSLFILAHWIENELISALIALSTLIPYYIWLWLNQSYMKKKFSFTIKPINQ
ncbi:MAG: SoxR reducing system RseC family protein [Bacteroidales bacterium]|nr:SoxR reducing system RseC family protein [Bacteroidales bacterium]